MKIWLTCVLALGLLQPVAADSTRKPNIILIMADDLGYQDIGCYGHPSIRTPVLDQLAKDGIRLTNFHSGAAVCTPSRMALLTGAYPVRLGWTRGVAGYLMGAKDGMSPEALTMAEVFKAEGYNTGISGKWHIGQLPGTRPHEQGFDRSFYNPMSNNQLKQIWSGDQIAIPQVDNRLFTEHFTHEALAFIRARKDEPFLLYLPYTAPHFDVEAHPEWKGKSKFGAYGDVVEELDARIGEIIRLLEEQNILQHTLIVFTSDNGAQGGQAASSLPYRGKKWSPLEGGTRVPCIISWPGKVPPGRTDDSLTAAIDLLPTLCGAAGIDLNTHGRNRPVIDGINVWDSLRGKAAQHPRTELLHWHGKSDQPQALTMGDWKYFPDQRDAITGADPSKRSEAPVAPALYHLREDVGELKNLSQQFPQRMEVLKKRFDELSRELAASPKLAIVTPAQQ
ncbi:MAG: Arylsulfatase precursor [Verrucomicrobiota bacterium]|jgi:arylsulfatase